MAGPFKARELEIELMPNRTVVLTLRCGEQAEAAKLYEGLTLAANTGDIKLKFGTYRGSGGDPR